MNIDHLQLLSQNLVKIINKSNTTMSSGCILSYVIGYMAKHNITFNLDNYEELVCWKAGYNDAIKDSNTMTVKIPMNPEVDEFIPQQFTELVFDVCNFVLND
jgi:hypothetical protein